MTQDGCMFYNDLAHYNDFGGAALESDEGARIANALGNKKAGILQSHGLITVGKSIESAVLWFITCVSMPLNLLFIFCSYSDQLLTLIMFA